MKFSEMPYTRVDFPAVIAQAQEIIQRASSAKSGEEQFEIHQEFNKLMDHVRTLYTIAHIRREAVEEAGVFLRALSEIRLAGRVAINEGLPDVCIFGR